jgi:hypothetical protein
VDTEQEVEQVVLEMRRTRKTKLIIVASPETHDVSRIEF